MPVHKPGRSIGGNEIKSVVAVKVTQFKFGDWLIVNDVTDHIAAGKSLVPTQVISPSDQVELPVPVEVGDHCQICA